MYSYEWDAETGGYLLNSTPLPFSKEPRPVYYREMDLLGFDRYWDYEKDDTYPYMWAEASKYYYRGVRIAQVRGGCMYHAPDLIVEDIGIKELQQVNIPLMIEKNRLQLESLVAETIKRIYNTYMEYKKKVDIFHVSYSGGKDSEVMLDLIMRTLPHDAFIVVFGNTGMEFPDTYVAVDVAKEKCERAGVRFYTAQARFTPDESWNLFGPPATKIRWCCSVHKTAPQLLKLREITGKSDFREMAFVGVRADESVRRSEYDYVSYGTKHRGQYSFNPILEWNSAEIYLYIYAYEIHLNGTYKKGNSRAGCLVCPMSGDHSDYVRQCSYPDEVERFVNIVRKMSVRALETEEDNKRYIETGGWKNRNNGRDIKSIPEKIDEILDHRKWRITVRNPFTDWKQWVKTAGVLIETQRGYRLEYKEAYIEFQFQETEDGYTLVVDDYAQPEEKRLVKMLKQVFRKAAYCVLCQECQADCPHGYISMNDGKLEIDDRCVHCGNCHKPASGCLLHQSLIQPKGNGTMTTQSVDCYADHAPKMDWMTEFFQKRDEFWGDNTLGTVMISMFKRFLGHAGLTKNNRVTTNGTTIMNLGIDNPVVWQLMLVNLSYTPEVGWYVKNIIPNTPYTREQMMSMLENDGAKERAQKSVTGSYRRILDLPFGSECGLGSYETVGRTVTYIRSRCDSPDPLVILYSLYKFAEACEGYYQFTLTTLMDDTIERGGISPTEIFGLSAETMERLLNGLSINHPEFISASFKMDLDSITLRPDKTSDDVLALFNA